jgi:hypothetical protein
VAGTGSAPHGLPQKERRRGRLEPSGLLQEQGRTNSLASERKKKIESQVCLNSLNDRPSHLPTKQQSNLQSTCSVGPLGSVHYFPHFSINIWPQVHMLMAVHYDRRSQTSRLCLSFSLFSFGSSRVFILLGRFPERNSNTFWYKAKRAFEHHALLGLRSVKFLFRI